MSNPKFYHRSANTAALGILLVGSLSLCRDAFAKGSGSSTANGGIFFVGIGLVVFLALIVKIARRVGNSRKRRRGEFPSIAHEGRKPSRRTGRARPNNAWNPNNPSNPNNPMNPANPNSPLNPNNPNNPSSLRNPNHPLNPNNPNSPLNPNNPNNPSSIRNANNPMNPMNPNNPASPLNPINRRR